MRQDSPQPNQDQYEARRQQEGGHRQIHLGTPYVARQPRKRSMMTLSSAPTLMPSRVEISGMAPALNNVPNSPRGRKWLSRNPPAKTSPRMPIET